MFDHSKKLFLKQFLFCALNRVFIRLQIEKMAKI